MKCAQTSFKRLALILMAALEPAPVRGEIVIARAGRRSADSDTSVRLARRSRRETRTKPPVKMSLRDMSRETLHGRPLAAPLLRSLVCRSRSPRARLLTYAYSRLTRSWTASRGLFRCVSSRTRWFASAGPWAPGQTVKLGFASNDAYSTRSPIKDGTAPSVPPAWMASPSRHGGDAWSGGTRTPR